MIARSPRAVCNGGHHGCLLLDDTEEPSAITPFTSPAGLGPADLASAYKLTSAPNPTNPAVTIAVVDAFHYPNAASDLATYRSQFGLPPCTVANGCLRIVNQSGAAAPLPTATDLGWNFEAALDLDMASAACPTCKLVLVEAQNDQNNSLFQAQNGAASLGVAAISNSWSAIEASNSTLFESFFTHPGIGIFAAGGQSGSGAEYPCTSPQVTCVGGTNLAQSTSAPRGWIETAGVCGTCSAVFAKPSWQTSMVPQTVCMKRATADVSAVAGTNNGVAVFNAGVGGWTVVGGTSAATPFVAGVHARYGVAGQMPSYAYQHASQYFDITTPTSSSPLCNAGAGWDAPSGIGSPNGAALAGGSCSHSTCSTGTIMPPTCDPCIVQVCAADSFCCNTSWDAKCVDEVSSVCNLQCPAGT